MLCSWIAKKEVKSYLELGFFTGALMRCLHKNFRFDKIAGADDGAALRARGVAPRVPPAAKICSSKLETPEYRQFRHGLGMVDLVFIDADHSYGSVRQDFERERKQPHRFLAFHDIKNTEHAAGVVRLWNEIGGKKRELVADGSGMGIGIWSQKETP